MLPDDIVKRLTAEDRSWYDKGVSAASRDTAYHCGDMWHPALCRVVAADGVAIDDANLQHVRDRGCVQYRVINEDNKKRKFRFTFRCELNHYLQFDQPCDQREISLFPNPPGVPELRATPHDLWFEVRDDGRPAVWTEVYRKSLQVSFEARRTPGHTMRKTVLELDLAGYSDIARTLEENLSAHEVATLNGQIQGFVDQGLGAVGLTRAEAVQATTGDGAILLFDRPEVAHGFARAVFAAAAAHNAGKTLPSAQRWFRMGAATGDIAIRPNAAPGGGKEIAGITIANAVRFEANARVGQLVVDAATYAALPPDVQAVYGPEEQVKGKRTETFPVRRCTMVERAVSDPPEPTPVTCLDLFAKLNPKEQLHRAMILVGMKKEHRPAQGLPLGQQFDAVLDWAIEKEGGIKQLDAVLTDLVEKQ